MTMELIYADGGACRCSPARPLNLRLAVGPNLIRHFKWSIFSRHWSRRGSALMIPRRHDPRARSCKIKAGTWKRRKEGQWGETGGRWEAGKVVNIWRIHVARKRDTKITREEDWFNERKEEKGRVTDCRLNGSRFKAVQETRRGAWSDTVIMVSRTKELKLQMGVESPGLHRRLCRICAPQPTINLNEVFNPSTKLLHITSPQTSSKQPLRSSFPHLWESSQVLARLETAWLPVHHVEFFYTKAGTGVTVLLPFEKPLIVCQCGD